VEHQHWQQLRCSAVADEGGIGRERQQPQAAHVATDKGGQRQRRSQPAQELRVKIAHAQCPLTSAAQR
jgi:hypothetical protein